MSNASDLASLKLQVQNQVSLNADNLSKLVTDRIRVESNIKTFKDQIVSYNNNAALIYKLGNSGDKTVLWDNASPNVLDIYSENKYMFLAYGIPEIKGYALLYPGQTLHGYSYGGRSGFAGNFGTTIIKGAYDTALAQAAKIQIQLTGEINVLASINNSINTVQTSINNLNDQVSQIDAQLKSAIAQDEYDKQQIILNAQKQLEAEQKTAAILQQQLALQTQQLQLALYQSAVSDAELIKINEDASLNFQEKIDAMNAIVEDLNSGKSALNDQINIAVQNGVDVSEVVNNIDTNIQQKIDNVKQKIGQALLAKQADTTISVPAINVNTDIITSSSTDSNSAAGAGTKTFNVMYLTPLLLLL